MGSRVFLLKTELQIMYEILDSGNLYRRLCIIPSRILSILERKDIGRFFEHLGLDSFLKMEITVLDFRIDGKTPSKNEILNKSDN